MYVAAFGDKRGVFKCENLKKANVPSRLGSDGSLYEVEYTVALIPILLLAPEEESIYGLPGWARLLVRAISIAKRAEGPPFEAAGRRRTLGLAGSDQPTGQQRCLW